MAQVHGGIDEKVEVTWDLPRCVIKTSLLMSLRPLIAMMKGLLGFREKGAKLKWNLWKLLRYGGDVEDTRADIPAHTGAQAAEDEPEGFLGGPSDL